MANIYIGTDNLVTLNNLVDEDGNYVNDATVQARVLDANGDEVSGETFPVTLSYVSGSDGKYQGTIDDGASLRSGAFYVIEVTAEKSGTKTTFRQTRKAQYKSFS